MTALAPVTFSSLPHQIFTETKIHVCRLTAEALETAQKIGRFILRHKKEIFIYSLLGTALLVTGAAFPKMALVVLPGLAYMLAFTNGKVIPFDVIEKITPDHKKAKGWIPRDPVEFPQFKQTIDVVDKTVETLKDSAPGKGWVVIQGHSGIGKSTLLMEVAKRMIALGHPVYLLRGNNLADGSIRSAHDIRWNVLSAQLNAESIKGKPPILLFDDITNQVNLNDPSFGDHLKSELYHTMNFQIVASTTSDRWQTQVDTAIKGRFHANHRLDDPSKEQIIEIAKHLRGKTIDASLSDELIHWTVDQIVKVPVEYRMRILFEKLFIGSEPFTKELIRHRMDLLGNVTMEYIANAGL